MRTISCALGVLLLLVGLALVEGHHQCGHNTKAEELYARNPAAREAHLRMKETISAKLAARRLMPRMEEDVAPIRIPIVWHVLSLPREDVITRAQIEAEMEYLNEWFSATNRYYEDASTFWEPVVAEADDFRIEFVLAASRPDGTAFDGIDFLQITDETLCDDAGVLNEDAWDISQYINIFVCDLSGSGVIGYTFLPGLDSNAIIVGASAIDSGGWYGAVTAHEMGHYLGLEHTFSDDSTCTDADSVEDTPITDRPQSDRSRDCPSPTSGSVNDFQACGVVTQVENVMDYNTQVCIRFFTKGQVRFMREVLASFEYPLRELPSSPALPPACEDYSCSGRQCGTDNCGHVCGVCASPAECTEEGKCALPLATNPTCPTAKDLSLEEDLSMVVSNVGLEGVEKTCIGEQTGALWFKVTAQRSGFRSTGDSVSIFESLTGDCSVLQCVASQCLLVLCDGVPP